MILFVALVLIMFICKIVEVLEKCSTKEQDEDETSSLVSAVLIDWLSTDAEIVPFVEETHTLSERLGGEKMLHFARDKPKYDFKKEYREWINNTKEYDRVRSVLI